MNILRRFHNRQSEWESPLVEQELDTRLLDAYLEWKQAENLEAALIRFECYDFDHEYVLRRKDAYEQLKRDTERRNNTQYSGSMNEETSQLLVRRPIGRNWCRSSASAAAAAVRCC